MKAKEWQTTDDFVIAFWPRDREDIETELVSLCDREEAFRVRGPGRTGFIWHCAKPEEGLARESDPIKPSSLPEAVYRAYVDKLAELSDCGDIGRLAKNRQERLAGLVARAYLAELGLAGRKSRMADGFPFRCEWKARPAGHRTKLRAHRVLATFAERVPFLSDKAPFSVVSREGVRIKLYDDGHLNIEVDVRPLWVDEKTLKLLSPPSRAEIVAATKAKLSQCRSLAGTFAAVVDPPTVELLP